MKTRTHNKVKLAAVVLLAVFISGNVLAQNISDKHASKFKTEIPEIMIQNLEVGIQTGNQGLKKSCIYFAGYYEIGNLVQPLVDQLVKESDPNTRVLIALALYKIGTDDAVKAIEKLAKNDLNTSVKRISHAILEELNFSNNTNISRR